MAASDSILLVSTQPTTIAAVASAMRAKGALGPENICSDLRGLAVRLRGASADAALIDLNGSNQQILRELDGVARQFRDTTFIILADTIRSDLLMEAMRVGAREFITTDRLEAELPDILQRISHNATPTAAGSLTTVLSASGGVGATTLAINLAWEMQLLNKQPVLLLDLDPCANTACRYLAMEPRFGLVNLLERSGQFDRTLVQGDSLSYAEKLSVLGSGPEAHMFAPIQGTPKRLIELIGVCQEAYCNVVVDVSRASQHLAPDLAQRSDSVLVVFQASVNDIRAARLTIDALVDGGVPNAAIHPILNRHRKHGMMIPMADIHEALPGRQVITLSNDYPSAIRAANLGLPLAQAAKRSDLRQDISELAASLNQPKVMAGV